MVCKGRLLKEMLTSCVALQASTPLHTVPIMMYPEGKLSRDDRFYGLRFDEVWLRKIVFYRYADQATVSIIVHEIFLFDIIICKFWQKIDFQNLRKSFTQIRFFKRFSILIKYHIRNLVVIRS